MPSRLIEPPTCSQGWDVTRERELGSSGWLNYCRHQHSMSSREQDAANEGN
jgi:hypothetical protein